MISVVIVNWNSGPLLEGCVSSLLKHAGECEILVVDNASEDSSMDFAVNAKLPLVLIRNPRNIGFAAASNLAWRRSRGGCILFLNPDTECFAGSVNRLAEPLVQEMGVWAAGGLLLDPAGKPQTSFNVRAFPTLGSVTADMLLLDEMWPDNPWTRRYRLSGRHSHLASDVDQPAAACLMVSRQAMESLGGFDESFCPAWFEDVDLCRRIWNEGRRIRFEPAARFLHHGSYSLGRLGREKFLEYFHTNQIRYFAKHHGAGPAERVRKLVVTGMCLRAALSLVRPPAGGASRAASARIFWRAARHFAASRGVPR
jgi:N-acetylglucosaminyl-diphospho-decaprenol L-rhamnosyltransferase